MTGNLEPNPSLAVKFLGWLNPDAALYLESMASQGGAKPIARQYAPQDTAKAIDFVASGNSDDVRRNMYFLPNAEFLQGARKKENMSAVRFLHVDLDYKDYPGDHKEQEDRVLALLQDKRIRPKGVPAPTAIWFTGGGCQALWKLEQPLHIEQAEGLNKALLFALQGGPGTHNADRLLRLPWTMNWLNDKKRATGREPALAFHFEPMNFDYPPHTFGVDAFQLKMPKAAGQSTADPSSKPATVMQIEPTPLPADLFEILPSDPGWVEAIVTGTNPPGKNYTSRSELVFACVLWMLVRGVQPGHVLSIITATDLGISAHVRENPTPFAYARRQIERALAAIEMRAGGWPVRDNDGRPIKNHPQNVRHALAVLGVDAQRNTFTQTDEFRGFGLDGRDLNDIAEILSSTFARDLDYWAAPAVIKRELLAMAHEQKYHPVLDYLDGLKWDGKRRIDTWLADYCGADDSDLNREFGSKFLIAGVRRIKHPGIKFDTMLVMEGPQGVGKSQVAQRLAVREDWFCGSLDLKSDDKTKAELLARAWIVECQELDGLNKSTSQNLKRFLSTSIDTYRRAYGRDAGEYGRHCIILGTTNEGAYLRDLTGNRRIWPVLVRRIDLARFSADLDQLWAEAVAREQAGEAITLSPHLWVAAAEVQGNRMVEDAFGDVLEDAFGEAMGRVSMDSVKLLLGIDTSRMSPMDTRRIKAIMAGLGWDYGIHRLHDLSKREWTQRRGFARGNLDERKVEYIAQRTEGGVVVITCLDARPDKEPPF